MVTSGVTILSHRRDPIQHVERSDVEDPRMKSPTEFEDNYTPDLDPDPDPDHEIVLRPRLRLQIAAHSSRRESQRLATNDLDSPDFDCAPPNLRSARSRPRKFRANS